LVSTEKTSTDFSNFQYSDKKNTLQK